MKGALAPQWAIMARQAGRFIGVSRLEGSARLLHALAEALDQPQRAGRPAFAAARQDILDSRLDRLDQCVRLGTYHENELIKLFEPAHLQQLRARHVEDEGGDTDTEEF